MGSRVAEAGDVSLWFCVLGPLRAYRGDTELSLGWPRQRAVLAALLLRAGQVVSRNELIDAVWGTDPPATAANVLHAYIAGLRRALDPRRGRREPSTLLASASPGYVLRLPERRLDLAVAARHLTDARRARAAGDLKGAVASFDAALALWQGIPLAGVPGPLAEMERSRLAELRLSVLEDRADTMLRLGAAADLAGPLYALAAENPFRERLAGLLMRTLHATGRQAEALAVYRDTRRHLVAELGAEPSPELRQLHDDVLKNRPPPGARRQPAGPPRQLPAAVRQFTGRGSELAALTALASEAARAPTAVIAAIGGTAGIGKSALAVWFGHRVADHFPGGQLYADLRGFGCPGKPAAPGEVIRGFLEALGAEPASIPAELTAQADLYRSMLAGKKVLLVLDNASGEDQVRPLLPGSGGCLVLVTSRRRLTGLAVAGGAAILTLETLTEAESVDLLASRVGHERVAAEPAAARELARLCARLPLALAIAAARAAGHPQLPLASLAAQLRDQGSRLDALDDGTGDTSVRSAYSWSYRALTPAAARMFRYLGLHPGPDVTAAAAASLAGVTAGQSRSALAELERAHLITEHAPGRYAFHDLLRVYAASQARADDSEAERRAATGRLLDHYLTTASAAAMLLNPAREPLDAEPAAEKLTGHDQALAWFEAERKVLIAATAHAAGHGFTAHAWGIPAAMTDFLERRGRWEEWADGQRTALDAARRAGNLRVQAVAHRNLGRALGRTGRYGAALAQLRDAIRLHHEAGDVDGEARAHMSVDWILAEQGRYREALEAAGLALRLFRSSGDRAGQARALNNAGEDHASLGEHAEALDCCEQALALHQGLGDRHGAAANWDSLGFVHHQLGDYPDADACYRRALALCRELGDQYNQAEVLTHLADTLCALDSPEEARDAWVAALGILDELGHPDAEKVRARLGLADRGYRRDDSA